MIAELNIFGIFINAGLIAALVAGVVLFGLRKALTAFGAYRLAWHPALFDLAMFVLVWGLVVLIESALERRLFLLLG